MKRILVSAYAVNPYKGSEDGTGWNLINQIARSQKAIVVTRKNNREPIERYLSENNVPNALNLSFEYYDLPSILRFYKKGERGALLYFYLWQLFLPFMVMKRKIEFDIAHHLNFHNNWTPTFLWILGKPFVWGPIGHHPVIPYRFAMEYGLSYLIIDRLKYFVKILFWRCDPFLRISLHKANAILAVNVSEKLVHRKFRNKITIMPAVASERVLRSDQIKSGFNVLSVGRFVALKGFDITIRSFAVFYFSLPEESRSNVKLTLVGKGPEKNRLRKIAKENNVEHAIEWIEWVEKSKMAEIYQQADLFLFPSHEGAGMVIPEALSYGIPILCFKNYGPGKLTDNTCALRVRYNRYDDAINQFSSSLHNLFYNHKLRNQLSKNAFLKWEKELCWEAKSPVFEKIYSELKVEKKEESTYSNQELNFSSFQSNFKNYQLQVETEF
jgi:glycosyltransferase involved in cell wall biosynthesis